MLIDTQLGIQNYRKNYCNKSSSFRNAKQQTTSPGRLPQIKTPITVPKSSPPTTTPKTQPEAVEKIKTFDISQQQNAVFPQVGVGSVVQIPIESTSEVQGKKPIEVR